MTSIEARRARIKKLIEEGRVETDKLRKQRKTAAKYQTQLQERAETILAGLVSPSIPKNKIPAPQVKNKAPEANIQLNEKVKFDRLSQAANDIIKELQSA